MCILLFMHWSFSLESWVLCSMLYLLLCIYAQYTVYTIIHCFIDIILIHVQINISYVIVSRKTRARYSVLHSARALLHLPPDFQTPDTRHETRVLIFSWYGRFFYPCCFKVQSQYFYISVMVLLSFKLGTLPNKNISFTFIPK